MNTNEQTNIAETLQDLLQRQLDLALQGNFSDMQALIAQTEPLVKQVTQTQLLDQPQFAALRENLSKLYKDLCLALTACKADTADQLNRVRKGKTMIGTYRECI